jgi:ATP-binding cassette subfamily B protein
LSIRENIAPSGGREERIWDCLEQAGVRKTVEKQPKQLDTPLFRNYHAEGVDLSGGEKQKLAIARALMKDSACMVLDEPSAALDPIAEMELYGQIRRIAQNKTCVFVTHRLSGIRFSSKYANDYLGEKPHA